MVGPAENKAWKILESEYLVKRPWLTARRDKVELPDGRVNDEYYVLEYPDWVNVIAVTEDGMFVMESQYRHGLGAACYEIPCGVIEEGEDPLEAGMRELLEETGYSGGTWRKVMTMSVNPGSMNNMIHCYLAEGVVKTDGQNLDATEDLSVHLMTREEVKELLDADKIVSSQQSAPLWKYFSMNP
jgi:8-oxo-dGTP pyrophosphatase MutT (NUDIX family)